MGKIEEEKLYSNGGDGEKRLEFWRDRGRQCLKRGEGEGQDDQPECEWARGGEEKVKTSAQLQKSETKSSRATKIIILTLLFE